MAKKSLASRVAASLVSTLALMHAVLLYGLIGENEIVICTLAALALFFLMAPKISYLLSLSVLLATLALAAGLKLTDLDESIYPSPTAKLITYDFWRGHQIFKKNKSLHANIPFGDLKSLSLLDMDVEPREVTFKTDSLGYRNIHDYTGEPYLLVGDSFIVSGGTDQKDMLGSKLEEDYGIHSYNLAAVGGDLVDYTRWIEHFYKNVNNPAKVLLFFFEGNDFEKVRDREQNMPAWRLFLKRYRNLFRFTGLGKFTHTQFHRFKSRSKEEPVLVEHIKGHKVGFLKKYVDITLRPSYPNPGQFKERLKNIKNHVERIYFIPTKYRVYAGLLDSGKNENLPDAQWEYLESAAQDMGIPRTDLTKPLSEAARALLDRGRLIWWKDDTHWNKYGIAVAAKAVAESLEKEDSASGRD
ncbi:MAG: hypothetical protein SVS15_05320 [Thermodesulfobacteriota bacterium]|nr:hypothetical protein [Thermodesulfobacteriota bacterium]